MKIIEIVALSALAGSVSAVAVPVRDKRQDVSYYSTTTDIITDVVWTTTTVWVQPSTAAQEQIGGFFESYSQSTSSSTPAAPAVVNAPASSAPSPSTTTTVAPAADPPAPSPTTSTTSVDPPAAVPATPTPAPAATTSASASSDSSSGSGSSSSGSGQGQYIGDMTYYDVSVGLGSCGVQGTNSQNLVALAADVMANGANPNDNPKCGQTINIYYNGETHTGTVYDTCPTCSGGSIDVTQVLFDAVAPDGNGRVHDVSWSFA